MPLYLTTGIGAFVLFAGNGLDAKTVTRLAIERPAFRIALSTIWVLATLPAARALLTTPETFFLRTLPVSRSGLLFLFSVALSIAHLPWCALWACGTDLDIALGTTLTVLAIQVQWIAGLRTVSDTLGIALALLALMLPPSLTAMLLAACSFVPGLRQAWIRAPEPPAAGRHALITSSVPLALGSALAISVYRGHRPVIVRALLFALAACLFALAALLNNGISELAAVTRLSLLFWGPACVFGAVGIAGPMLRAEAKARWILDLCGTPRSVRVTSAVGLLAAWGCLCGAGNGAVIGETLGLERGLVAFLALNTAGAGAAWSALSMSIVRRVRQGSAGGESGRLLLALSGLILFSAAVLALWPASAVPILLVAAGTTTALSARASLGSEPLEVSRYA